MALPELPTDWTWPFSAKLLGIWRALNNGTYLKDSNNDFPNVPDLNAVAPLEMAYNAPQSRFDLSIQAAALNPDVPTARSAYVDAINGADTGDNAGEVGNRNRPFLTIKAANAAITTASPGNPFLLQVHPGILVEDNPIQLKPGITVTGSDGAGTVLVLPQDDTQPVFLGAGGVILKDISIQGASGIGGRGVFFQDVASVPPAVMLIAGVRFADCEKGIEVVGDGAFLQCVGCVFEAPMARAIESRNQDPDAGAGIFAVSATINGAPGFNIAQAVAADGGAVFATASLIITFADSGLYTANVGLVVANGVSTNGVTNPYHISSTGGLISIGTGAILDNGVMLVESASGVLVTGAVVHNAEPQIVDGAQYFGVRYNQAQQIVVTEGSACIGDPARPGGLSAGQGCATANGMTALHYDGLAYVDVTAELTSPTGSEIGVVPGTGLGNYLYLGAPRPFSGLELLVTLAKIGGTLTPEYWKDGVGWAALDWMTTRDNEARGNELFAAVGAQDQRFGALPDWVATVVNGVSAYWYRVGVTSALSTIPRLEQAKLHYSYTRISGFGAVEVFGDEEPEHEIDVDLAKWVGESGAALPNSVVLSYDANVSKTVASYPSSSPRGSSYELDYPSDADTSRPFRLILEASSSNTDVATYVMALYRVRVPPSSTLNGGLTGGDSELKIVTPTGTANQTQLLTYEIQRPEAISGTDRLCLTLRRETNNANDTHTGAVQISKATMLYRRWKP